MATIFGMELNIITCDLIVSDYSGSVALFMHVSCILTDKLKT